MSGVNIDMILIWLYHIQNKIAFKLSLTLWVEFKPFFANVL